MEPTEKGFKLSTGREFYANLGQLSMGADLELCYGSDGYVREGSPGLEDIAEAFTGPEKREIAAYMIDLWTRWAAGEGL